MPCPANRLFDDNLDECAYLADSKLSCGQSGDDFPLGRSYHGFPPAAGQTYGTLHGIGWDSQQWKDSMFPWKHVCPAIFVISPF